MLPPSERMETPPKSMVVTQDSSKYSLMNGAISAKYFLRKAGRISFIHTRDNFFRSSTKPSLSKESSSTIGRPSRIVTS